MKPLSKTTAMALVKGHQYAAVREALRSHPEILNYRGKRGENLLHICCGVAVGASAARRAASTKTADALIEAGIDVNAEAFSEGSWRATPLWYAVGRAKNLTLAGHLIARGSTPEYCLWAAAYNDDPAAVKLLCEAGAIVDAPGDETPLIFAVRWGRFAAARALLEHGADPNATNAEGKTALHYMLKKRSDPKVIRLFRKYGARAIPPLGNLP